jgi:predicted nucleic acid-binding protein
MNADFPVVLDTCVLVPAALCDTLLRLAERRLYLPRWSEHTMPELERALIQGIGLTPAKAAKRVGAIREHFADAVVQGSEALIPAMTNPVKDRHVLAAAVRSKSDVIVTLNLRDFPDAVLAPFFVEARHPDRFLIELYDLSPEVVVHSLHAQAETISRSLQELLGTLRRVAPRFVDLVTGDLEI